MVATPIGHLGDITLRALVTLAQVDAIACEDTRVSGGMLSKYGIKKPLMACHDHNEKDMADKMVAAMQAGQSIAYISDAGMPLISDPGFRLVTACRQAGVAVTIIPGANAALTALAGSGLPTDQFHFYGFLPAKAEARRKALEEIAAQPGTLIFYEAPQRLPDSLTAMAATLGGDRPVTIARELTKLFEEYRSGTLAELAADYAGTEVKGEVVVCVGPSVAERPAVDWEAMLEKALQHETLRDAVTAVSAATGVKKSIVYTKALEMSDAPNHPAK